jgi:hypothetical protein
MLLVSLSATYAGAHSILASLWTLHHGFHVCIVNYGVGWFVWVPELNRRRSTAMRAGSSLRSPKGCSLWKLPGDGGCSVPALCLDPAGVLTQGTVSGKGGRLDALLLRGAKPRTTVGTACHWLVRMLFEIVNRILDWGRPH